MRVTKMLVVICISSTIVLADPSRVTGRGSSTSSIGSANRATAFSTGRCGGGSSSTGSSSKHPLANSNCNTEYVPPTGPATLQTLQQELSLLHRKIDTMALDLSYTKEKVTETSEHMEELIRSSVKTSCAQAAADGPALPGPLSNRPALYSRQGSLDGVFAIYPTLGKSKMVKCDKSSTGDPGWMVVLLRQTGEVAFNRTFGEYAAGFGDPSSEVWIGLDTLHAITESEPQILRVELKNFEGRVAYAQYNEFKVGPRSSKYRLEIGDYDPKSTAGDALKDHNRMQFSTLDVDNDNDDGSCSIQFGGGGGWWYATCYNALGTGRYRRPVHPGLTYTSSAYGGVTWHPFSNVQKSLQMFKMIIKPKN